MKSTNTKTVNRLRKHKKIRAKISGTAERPRLSVFKSNTAVYAELINDDLGNTIAAVTTQEFKKLKGDKSNEMEKAKAAGLLLGKRAGEKGVKKAVFDRGGYVYAGKVKALAEGAREGGLDF